MPSPGDAETNAEISSIVSGLKPLPRFLPFSPPSIGPFEIEAVTEALKSLWLTTGPRAERFEGVMAQHLGTSGALALSSCTAGLHLGLKVMGLGPGQAIVTSPLTFVSTAHAAVYNRARVFLCDISPDTGNLDPDKLEEFFEKECYSGYFGFPIHRKTGLAVRALAPVHYGGHPADLARLWEIAIKHKLGIIEDAAHALGSVLNGFPIGHPGHRPKEAGDLPSLAAFSFYATKNISTGEGGLLVSSDQELLARARKLSAYGITDARRIWDRYAPQGTWAYDVDELGHKCNFTDIQAALGLAQMSRLAEFQGQRANHAQIWAKALGSLTNLVELPVTREGVVHSWHLYPLRLKPRALKISRDKFIMALKALNIGTSVMFIPIHYHSYYRKLLGYKEGDFPVAEDFFSREVSLPLSPAHSAEAIEEAALVITKLLEKHAR
ncbi:MAG: DegT/DnrJ/EryC1/StrS aminotransferase family protein [Deltaproteobacteria bacterium]|jgi:dTDP-4-amino-4,6-dideoxygalactose transaminase|nr:DegT/DnrJ/EryC1/StrS aminotransferase family protein [Deltaproteobacteria bacterium]